MITWLASYPRSGNTWVRSILWSYFDEVDLTTSRSGGYFRELKENFNESILVKTHNKESPNSNSKAVLLIRHPYDCLNSIKNWNKHWKNPTISEDETCEGLIDFLNFYYNDYSKSDRIIISYEEMHYTPVKVFKKLFDFLGLDFDEEKFHIAYQANQIDNYKINGFPDVSDSHSHVNLYEGLVDGILYENRNYCDYRVGQVGEGRKNFSALESDIIKKMTKPTYNKMGYFLDDKEW